MKIKLKILFRTSGGRAKNTQLGMGHIYRCINLASCLENLEKYFLIEDYGGVKKVLEERGFNNILTIPAKITLKNDLQKTIHFIKTKNIDIVIVDKYEADSRYIKEIKKKSKVVVISDLKKINYSADLVVNGFIGYENKIFVNKSKTKFMLGPKYQILNKKFSKKLHVKKLYDLIVTFGGYDENKIIELFLKILIKYNNKLSVKVILGPATKKTKYIKEIEEKFPNIEIVSKVNDLHRDINSAKFGVCSGGITTYEFESAGVPFAIICQHQHQKITAREWNKKKIAIDLGFPNLRINNKIERLIQNIINNENLIKKKHHKIVDGKGTFRVEREILKIVQKE